MNIDTTTPLGQAALPALAPRRRVAVVGAPIDALDWAGATETVCRWAAGRESRYVCICNVHSVVTARDNAEFRRAVECADMATPDGAPVAWTMRRKGLPTQGRINGPDFMLRLCEQAAARGIAIGLHGSTEKTLALLEAELRRRYPTLRIPYIVSPPFRVLTEEEDRDQCERINASGVGILFVGLGCPKQEVWMHAHRGRVNAVMLGVGAAFDYHAGTVPRAPQWMQANGLEWLHRLASEPRRLWQRYFDTNSRFIALTVREWLTGRLRPSADDTPGRHA